MGVWLGPRGLPKRKKPPAFTYTGNYELHYDTAGDDGAVNWQIVFLSSGTLRFFRVVDTIDVFLVGHGETGHQGYYRAPYFHGGKGGRGGELKTVTGVPVSAGIDYSIVIPEEGYDTTASFSNDCYARSGNDDLGIGVEGGAGAYVADNNPFDAVAGSQGGLSFGGNGDRSGYYPTYRYGASGGGGGAGSPNGTRCSGEAGGTNGGGSGGNYNGDGGEANQNNSGSGGGGGGKDVDTDYPGGAGGPGIVIIRNAR